MYDQMLDLPDLVAKYSICLIPFTFIAIMSMLANVFKKRG